MTEKDLQYFCAAYETQNISHAAKQIFITPQGLSKALKRLEKELGVPLFKRNQIGIIPTNYADQLYKNSQDIIAALTNIKNSILETKIVNKRTLTIALTLGVIDYLGVEYISEYQQLNPDISLNIVQNSDLHVNEMLQAEQAEIGVLAGPIDTTIYDATLFTSHRHCLVINRSHLLAQKKAITYEDLAKEPIALEGREFKPYHNNYNRFISHGIHPNIVLETTEIESTHRFASQNNGIGLSVDFCAFSHPYKNTVILPFADSTCLWQTFFVTKKNAILSKAAKQFYDYSLQWVKDHDLELFHWNQ